MKMKSAEKVGVWCCEKQYKCAWQGSKLHQGLAWGAVPKAENDEKFLTWRKYHDSECGGKLIQLVEPGSDE